MGANFSSDLVVMTQKTLDQRLRKYYSVPKKRLELPEFRRGLLVGLDIVNEIVVALDDGPLEQPEVDALVELMKHLRNQCKEV